MAKVLPVTPTLLNTFKTCPLQYKAKYITKDVKFVQNAQAKEGERVHKVIETALTDTQKYVTEPVLAPLVKLVRAYAAQTGVDMYVEKSFGITADGVSCTWKDPAVECRAKLDVLLVDHNKKINYNIDWKTGKPKIDRVQMHISAMCATAFSGYKTNKNLWVHIKHKKLIHDIIKLDSLIPVQDTLADINLYKRACEKDYFPPNPNGLCKQWCDVLYCEYNGRRNKKR